MGMALKAGSRFKSAVCDTQVMVIKAPPGEHELACGGALMLAPAAAAPAGLALVPGAAESLIGKRYVNSDELLELLCTKGGKGSLALNGTPLEVKQAKQLPSSD